MQSHIATAYLRNKLYEAMCDFDCRAPFGRGIKPLVFFQPKYREVKIQINWLNGALRAPDRIQYTKFTFTSQVFSENSREVEIQIEYPPQFVFDLPFRNSLYNLSTLSKIKYREVGTIFLNPFCLFLNAPTFLPLRFLLSKILQKYPHSTR